MSATGRGKERVALDFYATPREAVEPIVPILRPYLGGHILEPSVGTGDIARALVAAGAEPSHITGIELDPARAEQATRTECVGRVVRGDALAILPQLVIPGGRPGLIITNPPYKLAQEFAEACLAVAGQRGVVALLLRLGFIASLRRSAFHRARPADVFILAKRPSFTGDGKSDACDYAWFLYGLPRGGGHWTILDPVRSSPGP